ncbi:hypothetical protein [Lentzea sp. NBRC 102530]|uniref:hypothetical protein n=1 Tax=Lentzea sp. NBRC 102530 TaxID=3032201 RepID=UPI0024A02366|nr:hypothetical protein [Lentzea sp. NBRC 102530]GLY51868.1 hypothetical protein Lesp01_55240 [Lentzea sp. NBRC 102530]
MSAVTRVREGVAAFGRLPAAPAAQQLAADAAEAAELRAYATHPDVVALRVERVRAEVDRLCWAGIVLGLGFTMTNVQSFAAAGTPAWSLPWLAAWLLDPTVSLVLLAILRAEQVTARYRVRTGSWTRRAKWFTLAATYVMNTWHSWATGSVSGVVLHSVPPLVVFVAAEAVTDLRDKLTEAVTAAFAEAEQQAVLIPAVKPLASAAAEPEPPKAKRTNKKVSARVSSADYLAKARELWTPEVTVSPAWVREVTGCSRGLSSRLASVLAAEIAEGGDGHEHR